MNTVNVVEYVNASLSALHAFSDDKEGNEQAEALFTKIAKENDFSDEEIESGLEDGVLSHSETDYQVFLIHSS